MSAETPEFTARTRATRNSTLANTESARCSQGSEPAPNQESLVRLTNKFGCSAPTLRKYPGRRSS